MPYQVIYRETDKQVSHPDSENSRQWAVATCDTMPQAHETCESTCKTFRDGHPLASAGAKPQNGYRFLETIVSYGRNYGSGDIIRQTDIYITVADK